MRRKVIFSAFLLTISLVSCDSPSAPVHRPVASFDFPLPASAELIYAFPNEPDKSYVAGTNDTLKQVVQFFLDSMKASGYELLEQKIVDSDNTILTYKKVDTKIILSILNLPVGNKKTSISIIFPKEH